MEMSSALFGVRQFVCLLDLLMCLFKLLYDAAEKFLYLRYRQINV